MLVTWVMQVHDAVEGNVLTVLAREFGVPPVDLSRHVFPLTNLALVPPPIARRELVLPVVVEPHRVAVAMANPLNRRVLEELRLVSGRRVEPAVSESSTLRRVIEAAYEAREHGQSHWVGSNARSCPWWERNLLEVSPEERAAARRELVGGARSYRAGDTAAAQRHLDRAVARAPRMAAPHRTLGLLHAHAGRLQDAQRELERALQLRPQDATAARNLAICLDRRGQRERARTWWLRTIERVPDARARGAIVLALALREPSDDGDGPRPTDALVARDEA